MLCKEQGITVLVQSCLFFYFVVVIAKALILCCFFFFFRLCGLWSVQGDLSGGNMMIKKKKKKVFFDNKSVVFQTESNTNSVANLYVYCKIPRVCVFLQGVNAAFDVLLICNVNVNELSQRLLLRKNLHAVSYPPNPPPPTFAPCVINYELPHTIKTTLRPLWCDASFRQLGEILRTGLLSRLALMGLGGLSMLYARWRIMGTGPPAFTEVDNPASFEENMFLRVSPTL